MDDFKPLPFVGFWPAICRYPLHDPGYHPNEGASRKVPGKGTLVPGQPTIGKLWQVSLTSNPSGEDYARNASIERGKARVREPAPERRKQ